MTTDQNIIACYNDLLRSLENGFEYIGFEYMTEYDKKLSEINRQYMLGKFELWMQEDLQRLGLINNTKIK